MKARSLVSRTALLGLVLLATHAGSFLLVGWKWGG